MLATQISNKYMVARAEFCTVVDTQRPIPQNDQTRTEQSTRQWPMKLQAICCPKAKLPNRPTAPMSTASGTKSTKKRTLDMALKKAPREIGWLNRSSRAPSSRALLTTRPVATSAIKGRSTSRAWTYETSTLPVPVNPKTVDSRMPTSRNTPASTA